MKDQKYILVVEDDVDLCNAILATLARNGYKPAGATDIREATFKLKNQAYACILLDIRLGEESGVTLIDAIRERKDLLNLETPVVVISGHLDRPLIQKIATRVQGALVKPFDMQALLENVKKHVAGPL